jgi:N-acetylglutamate synthase-like GNAT family acetyltransferase
MIISRATKQDLPAIQYLMQVYGNKMIVTEDHLNRKDIALQARADDGALVGFVWGGLMVNNTVMYIDKLAVAPEYAKQGVALKLHKELLKLGLKLGVKQGFGVIRRDEYHDKSCMSALKMAFGAEELPYTYVMGDTMNIVKELEQAGI